MLGIIIFKSTMNRNLCTNIENKVLIKSPSYTSLTSQVEVEQEEPKSSSFSSSFKKFRKQLLFTKYFRRNKDPLLTSGDLENRRSSSPIERSVSILENKDRDLKRRATLPAILSRESNMQRINQALKNFQANEKFKHCNNFALCTFTENDLITIGKYSTEPNWQGVFINFLQHLNNRPNLIYSSHFQLIDNFFKEVAETREKISNEKCVAIELYQSYHALDNERPTPIPMFEKLISYCKNIIISKNNNPDLIYYIDLASRLLEETTRLQLKNLENLSNLYNYEDIQTQIMPRLLNYEWKLPAYFIIKEVVKIEEYKNLSNTNNIETLPESTQLESTKILLSIAKEILNKINRCNKLEIQVKFKPKTLEQMVTTLIPIIYSPENLSFQEGVPNVMVNLNINSSVTRSFKA